MNTSELLHTLAKDRISGLRTIDNYQLKPVVVLISQSEMSIDLNNDMWILNTKALPKGISQIQMLSSDNVFIASPEEYDLMDEYRYQVFTDYIDLKTIVDNFQAFRLEFVKIIPHRKQ